MKKSATAYLWNWIVDQWFSTTCDLLPVEIFLVVILGNRLLLILLVEAIVASKHPTMHRTPHHHHHHMWQGIIWPQMSVVPRLGNLNILHLLLWTLLLLTLLFTHSYISRVSKDYLRAFLELILCYTPVMRRKCVNVKFELETSCIWYHGCKKETEKCWV